MPLRVFQTCLDKVSEKLKSNEAEQCRKAGVEVPVRRVRKASVSSFSSLSDLGTTPELTDDEFLMEDPKHSIGLVPACSEKWASSKRKQSKPSPSKQVQDKSRRHRTPGPSPGAQSAPGVNPTFLLQHSAADQVTLFSQHAPRRPGLRSTSRAAPTPCVPLPTEDQEPCCKFSSSQHTRNDPRLSRGIQLDLSHDIYAYYLLRYGF